MSNRILPALFVVYVNISLPPSPAVHTWRWGTSNLSASPVQLYIYSAPSTTYIFYCYFFLSLSVRATYLVSACNRYLSQAACSRPAVIFCTSSFISFNLLLFSCFLFWSLLPARRSGLSHRLSPTSTNRSLRYSDRACLDPSFPKNRSAPQCPVFNISDQIWCSNTKNWDNKEMITVLQ